MTKLLCSVLACLPVLLVGCTSGGGYCSRPGNAQQPVCKLSEAQQAALPVVSEWWHPTQTIALHPLGTEAQQEGLRLAAGGHGGMRLSGLAVPDVDSGRCDLFVALPAAPDPRDFEVVGHEAMHCFVGGFHPDMLSGKKASSYLTPAQAAAQRRELLSAVAEADDRSRWTVSCTFGLGKCPPRSPGAGHPMAVTLHPATAEQLGRISTALGRDVSGSGISLSAAERCDLYVPMPTSYLGKGMEIVGRRLLECRDNADNPAELLRRRAAVEKAWSEDR